LAARIVVLVAFVAVVLGTGVIHARIPPTRAMDGGHAFVPDPALAGLLSLGFNSLVSDYYWLQAVQAIGGDTVISAELGDHLGKLIDVVTTLDPWVDHPYRFAAVWLTESEQNVRTANRLLERGIEHHPDEWRNRFYLGFNHFYYLMDNDAAAEILLDASRLPGSPPYLARLVARLRSHTADIDVSEVFLRELVRGTQDEGIRAGYEAALDEIEIEKKARYLDRAREQFETLHGRDIMHISELVEGPLALVPVLPNPEPESLPRSLSRGSVWELDFESDTIISTYYGDRYQLHFAPWERAKAIEWAEQREAKQQADLRTPHEPTRGNFE